MNLILFLDLFLFLYINCQSTSSAQSPSTNRTLVAQTSTSSSTRSQASASSSNTITAGGPNVDPENPCQNGVCVYAPMIAISESAPLSGVIALPLSMIIVGIFSFFDVL